MTLIKNINFSEKEISMMLMDSSNSYLWLGFKQDASGNCAFKKTSWNNPLQSYFDVDIAVDEIKKAVCDGLYIYLALDDSSLIGRRYTRSTPITTPTDFSIPAGITETPVDILVSTYVYFLISGSTSGTNAKIVKFSLTGTYQETIDLATVTNAKAFTIDDNDEFWCITYSAPSEYIRVYQMSGDIWTYTVNS